METATNQDNDPALLDELQLLGDVLTGAPDRLIEQLLDAFHVTAVYNNDVYQVTINTSLTDATLQAIADLLADPRTDQATTPATAPTRPKITFATRNQTREGRCDGTITAVRGPVMAPLPR